VTDELILVAVLGLRLGIPLLVFRFPLPAILAALVIDAADQSIFQLYTDLDLTGYQGYDKALDVYYLALAYLSTFRNWADPFAARVAQLLWYYRLVGVVAFELAQVRALLLVFPNTFEYFFICYEVVRLAWDPRRLSRRQVVGLAAFIWIFVKLPQEWWIHVAQLDFTDVMRENVLGVDLDTPWGEALAQNLWFVALLVVLAVAFAALVRWALRAAPPPDWPTSVDVDRHRRSTRLDATPAPVRFLEWDLVEKVVLTSLIAVIFSQVIPGTESTPLQVTFTVTLLVVANAAVSQWLARHGHSWSTTFRQFAAMVGVNAAISVAYLVLFRREAVNEAAAVFFLLLLTLIITFYDRYRPVRSATYPPVRVGSGSRTSI
jgi:hypothetical protein